MWFHLYSDYLIADLGVGDTILWAIIIIGILIIFFSNLICGRMSKSLADTGEIDAIACLLKTEPPPNLTEFFKKVGQMTVSKSTGSHYRLRLLESLTPFLLPQIILRNTPAPSLIPLHHQPTTKICTQNLNLKT